MRKFIPTIMVLALLGACSTTPAATTGGIAGTPVTTTASTTSSKTLLALGTALQAAQTLANDYAAFPACTGSNGPLCSNPKVVTDLANAESIALGAYKTAEATQAGNDLSAGWLALSTLTTALSEIKS